MSDRRRTQRELRQRRRLLRDNQARLSEPVPAPIDAEWELFAEFGADAVTGVYPIHHPNDAA